MQSLHPPAAAVSRQRCDADEDDPDPKRPRLEAAAPAASGMCTLGTYIMGNEMEVILSSCQQ